MVRIILLLFVAILRLPSEAQKLDAIEQRVLAGIDASTEADISLLEKIVNINSGTMNPEGVAQVGKVFEDEFAALGFTTRWISMAGVQRSGHLIAKREGRRGKRVLIIGHLDTVFERDHPFQTFTRNGMTAAGPGVVDMKGGLVIVLSALRALREAKALGDATIRVVLTGDEEDPGSPIQASRRDLIEAAMASDVALCFESTYSDQGQDYVTIARRGIADWSLRVNSQTGHSSTIFSEKKGSGAAFETARILTAFHDQLGEPNLTFNASVVLAGASVQYDELNKRGTAAGKTNVIPEIAVASGDIRALSREQYEAAMKKMQAIVAAHLPKTGAELKFEEGMPPMPPTAGNRALAGRLNEVNQALGLTAMPILDPAKRGAADIQFVAHLVDSLSGLGASGENAHAWGETIDLSRLPIQTRRAALLIYRLTR